MRIVWTDPGPVSGAWDTLRARGYEIGQLRQESISGGGRIVRRFPILVADSGEFVEEAFGFLFDVAYIRGSTQSVRTLETYAESLLSWLTYAERERLQWRRPTTFMLAAYRDHLLGTRGFQKRERPLSRRTVNLRLTIAIEFYRHLGWIERPRRGQSRSQHTVAFDTRRMVEGGPCFESLRLRIYSRRPLALRAEHCRALCFELRNPYRLMWQWALCTGLRTISLVQMELAAFQSLQRCSGDAQALDITAKGGKVVTVNVPQELRKATERYIAVDRVMAAALGRPKSPGSSLFLNLRGRPVTGKSYYRALKRACQRLKITAHPHQARTTFATYVRDKLERLNREGREIDAVKVVQALLAHADARTTEQYLESIDVPSLDVLAVLDELCEATVDAVA